MYKLITYKLKQLNILENKETSDDELLDNLEICIKKEKKYLEKDGGKKIKSIVQKDKIFLSYYFLLEKAMLEKLSEKKKNIKENLNLIEIQKNLQL